MLEFFSAFMTSKLTKMTKFAVLLSFITIGTCLPGCGAFASSILLEASIAAQIRQSLNQGEAIELQAGQRRFLAIHAQTSLPTKRGGVIILHGMNQNPDFPRVIRPLRTGLTESGWDTLSLQMPAAYPGGGRQDIEKLAAQAALRIQAGIQFFKENNVSNIAITAHGMGATMAAFYLGQDQFSNQQKQPGSITALLMISMDGSQQQASKYLEKLELPILDIYGSQDIDPVKATARERKLAVVAKAGNLNYRQVRMQGADHYFTGQEQALVRTVRSWLAKNAGGAKPMPQ